MKSIFRTIALLTAFASVLSCHLDALYIQLPETQWTIEQDSQKGWIHFSDERVSLVLRDRTSGAVQLTNGDYVADGHAVTVSNDNGSSTKLVRTFSHLKNSANKNFSSLSPESLENMHHTVWAGLSQNNFDVLYFTPDGYMKRIGFQNVIHEEGVPYGWGSDKFSYSQNGNQVSWGDRTGTLFSEVMLVNDVWYIHFPVNEDTGTSSLYGTFWTYRSSGYPGILIFDTNSTFTRILLSSNILFQISRGTYTLDGDSLHMSMDGKQETCTLSGNSFTFMERTYEFYE